MLASWALPGLAFADDAKQRCVDASDRAQSLRDKGALVEAREQLLLCARPECPGVVTGFCDKWLSEVNAALPTVVVIAKDGAAETSDVELSIDGVVARPKLDGRAIPLDPGDHELSIRSADGRVATQHVVAHEGQKDVPVTIALAARASPSPPPAPPLPPPPSEARGTPVLAWVLGGGGLAAAGVFAVIAATGQRDYDTCKTQGCPSSTRDSLAVRRDVAFVSAGVSVALLATSAWLFLRPTPRSGVALSFDKNTAFATVRWTR